MQGTRNAGHAGHEEYRARRARGVQGTRVYEVCRALGVQGTRSAGHAGQEEYRVRRARGVQGTQGGFQSSRASEGEISDHMTQNLSSNRVLNYRQ